MFKQDTLNKLNTLDATDVIHVLEAAYSHYAKKFYEQEELRRNLREAAPASAYIPSPHSVAPRHQHRHEAIESANRNQAHYKKLCDTLNYVLRDLNEAHNTQSAKDIVDFLKSR